MSFIYIPEESMFRKNTNYCLFLLYCGVVRAAVCQGQSSLYKVQLFRLTLLYPVMEQSFSICDGYMWRHYLISVSLLSSKKIKDWCKHHEAVPCLDFKCPPECHGRWLHHGRSGFYSPGCSSTWELSAVRSPAWLVTGPSV